MSTKHEPSTTHESIKAFNASEHPVRFTFYEDAGHGWLEVPLRTLEALGIAEKISGFSYQKEDMVYLEEDMDAVTFWNAYLQAIGRPKDYQYGNSLVYEKYHHTSPVRSYRDYQVKK